MLMKYIQPRLHFAEIYKNISQWVNDIKNNYIKDLINILNNPAISDAINSDMRYKFHEFKEKLWLNIILQEKLQILQESGIVKLTITDLGINKDLFEWFINNEIKKLNHYKWYATNKDRMFDLTWDFYFWEEFWSDFILNTNLISIIANYLEQIPRFIGTKTVYHTINLTWKETNHQQRHRDYHDLKWIKMFVLFNDVWKNQWPTEFIQYSHYKWQYGKWWTLVWEKKYFNDNELESILWNAYEENKVLCTGKKGDIYLIDTFWYHKWWNVSEWSRLLSITWYATQASLSSDILPVNPELSLFKKSIINQLIAWI